MVVGLKYTSLKENMSSSYFDGVLRQSDGHYDNVFIAFFTDINPPRQEDTSDFEDDDDYFDSSVSFKSEEETDDLSDGKHGRKAELWIERPARAVALYSFMSENSETLDMSEGEEFIILEDDIDGWTKVRRRKNRTTQKDLGFVPSSFLKNLL